MHISRRSVICGLFAAGLTLSASTAAQAAGHSYVPFSIFLNGGGNQGMWLADTSNLGNPPFQLTNQVLDGNSVVLDDWTLNPITHLATNVTPQLVVYGQGGNLYKANLKTIGPVTQFSSGNYTKLCSLTALDERPYAAAKAYVQAIVEPVGSLNTCASGVGTQTWLIPANADNTVAPIIEPSNWSVLGAFTDPTDESFVRWVVWTGNAVAAYKANFSSSTTLLVGPPTGPAPGVLARQDGTILLQSSADDGTNTSNGVYRVTMTGSALLASYSHSDSSICIGNTGGAVLDSTAGIATFALVSNSGYIVNSVSLTSGAPTQTYADSSGNECGAIGGDTVSGGYAGINEVDMTTGFEHVIAIDEAGPGTQTPVFLGGNDTVFAFLRYTINGNFWIDLQDVSGSPTLFSEQVVQGNGTVVQSYANARIGDDIWSGYDPSGKTPGVERDVVYLFSLNVTPCTGGTLAAIDPVAFTSTNISGVPADACTTLAYGWQPASVGYVREGSGSRPVEIDPVGGKMYSLLGPDPTGLFENIAILPGYPFY